MLTFRALGVERLTALCTAIGFDSSAAVKALETTIGPWGARAVGRAPRWGSDITDDHTPVELSLSIEGERLEPRFLVESQGDDGSLESRWRAARATNERLHRRYGVSLERAALVEDLFAPRDDRMRFAMWHAAWMRAGTPLFKVYYNPAASGAENAPLLVESALRRLGLAGAWRSIEAVLARRPSANSLLYFSLDLAGSDRARVKVYVAHPGATADEIEPVLALSPHHVPGDAVGFCRRLIGGDIPLRARPLLTCHSFTSDNDGRAGSVTLHVPVRCFVDNDQVAMERIASQLSERDGRLYRKALRSIASRPLASGAGIQTYASFCRQDGLARITAYLALEAYRAQPPLGSTARPALSMESAARDFCCGQTC